MTYPTIEPVTWTEPAMIDRDAIVARLNEFADPAPQAGGRIDRTQAGNGRAPDNRAQEWTHA